MQVPSRRLMLHWPVPHPSFHPAPELGHSLYEPTADVVRGGNKIRFLQRGPIAQAIPRAFPPDRSTAPVPSTALHRRLCRLLPHDDRFQSMVHQFGTTKRAASVRRRPSNARSRRCENPRRPLAMRSSRTRETLPECLNRGSLYQGVLSNRTLSLAEPAHTSGAGREIGAEGTRRALPKPVALVKSSLNQVQRPVWRMPLSTNARPSRIASARTCRSPFRSPGAHVAG